MTPPSERNSLMVSVFFYDLFMDADALRSKGFHPTNVRQARVDGMALQIGHRATLTPDPSKSAHGFLMDLSRRELDRLYTEPSVTSYRPEIVRARLTSGHSIAVVCYNLPVPPELTERNAEHAAKIRELGRRLGLPAQYMESIA